MGRAVSADPKFLFHHGSLLICQLPLKLKHNTKTTCQRLWALSFVFIKRINLRAGAENTRQDFMFCFHISRCSQLDLLLPVARTQISHTLLILSVPPPRFSGGFSSCRAEDSLPIIWC